MQLLIRIQRFLLIGATLLTASVGTAEEKTAKNTHPAKNAPDFEHVQALRLLEQASLEAKGFDPLNQGTIYYAVAKTYFTFDKAKGTQAIRAAYESVRVGFGDAAEIGSELIAQKIIQETVKASPESVEKALPEGIHRDYAISYLAAYYVQNKKWDRAIDALSTLQDADLMVYPVRDLLMNLPTSRHDDCDRVFSLLLRAYSSAQYQQQQLPEDLGTIVVRFWRKLSPDLVHQAIDVLLKQAKDAQGIEIRSSKDTVALTGYQFRLFQLLPILKAIDPDEADSLLAEQAQIADLLKKYPQGQQTIDPSIRDTPPKDGEQQQASYIYGTSVMSAHSLANLPEIGPISKRISDEASTDPDNAISDAAGLTDPVSRVRTLMEIARVLASQNPTGAKEALRKAVAGAPDDKAMLIPMEQVAGFAKGLGNTDIASDAIKVGLHAARQEYDDDADLGNPNTAAMLYWPSVRAYQDLIILQAKISPDAALETIKNLPDPEIAALEKVMLAASWLKVPILDTSPIAAKRNTAEH